MAPAGDRAGYWGPPTSTLDWCEENYVVSSYIAEFSVGLGSWCFHMTLKYEMQLLDELPMIYSCCVFVYCLILKRNQGLLRVSLVFVGGRDLEDGLGNQWVTFAIVSLHRGLRERLPPLVGVVTQFHAWWHIFTGLGSYLHILFSLYSRTLYLKYRPKVKRKTKVTAYIKAAESI
ncbi:PREDICTED: alkaline ceramidase 3 [Thamnophis sirtalis]|uniref:Alkaline ceramidase n=1 Tax=Thamnophis sirtalis TaxID=35019 RepID=A0A6I9Y854_9SAUR|nr:PREDICTED: alkaline ceramidase 3 [Thamnophis sirtalis]